MTDLRPASEAKQQIKSRDMQRLAEYRDQLRKNPRLTYLFVELTDRCNLHCLHCGSRCEQTRGSMLDTPLLLKTLTEVAEDFDPSSVMVCLTGGEPLLHPDFETVAGAVQALGFPWGMTTNGTLIDAGHARRLRSLGLQSVTVSLDGLRADHDRLRQISGSFDRTVNAIRHCNDAGIPVQVTTVIHKQNFRSLEAMYAFLCGLEIASWRVINLEPIGRALEHSELLLDRNEFLRLLEFIREKRFDAHTPMDVRFGCSHYLSCEYEHEVRDNYFLCGSGIYVAGILCNGDIVSCLDIPRRPELVQGNIATDRFSRVWREGFRIFRQDRTALCAECSDCPERTFCGGDAAHTWDYDNNTPLFCLLRKENPYEINRQT